MYVDDRLLPEMAKIVRAPASARGKRTCVKLALAQSHGSEAAVNPSPDRGRVFCRGVLPGEVADSKVRR